MMQRSVAAGGAQRNSAGKDRIAIFDGPSLLVRPRRFHRPAVMAAAAASATNATNDSSAVPFPAAVALAALTAGLAAVAAAAAHASTAATSEDEGECTARPRHPQDMASARLTSSSLGPSLPSPSMTLCEAATATSTASASSSSSSNANSSSSSPNPRNVMLHRMRSVRGRGLDDKYIVDWKTILGEGAYGSVHPARLRATGEKVRGRCRKQAVGLGKILDSSRDIPSYSVAETGLAELCHALFLAYSFFSLPLSECLSHSLSLVQVALKKISRRYTNSSGFKTETDALLRIYDNGGHPNISGLRDMYEDHNFYYLILDLVTGGEMFEHLINYGAYSEADAARLMHEIASALAFLHGVRVLLLVASVSFFADMWHVAFSSVNSRNELSLSHTSSLSLSLSLALTYNRSGSSTPTSSRRIYCYRPRIASTGRSK